MDGQEKDYAKARKFQERLERISRRRFMRMAALGGLTATGILSTGDAHALPGDKERCDNTRKLIRGKDNKFFRTGFTVDEAFRGKRFVEVLESGRENFLPETSEEYIRVTVLIAAIEAAGLGQAYLREFFTDNKETTQALIDALDAAEDYFVIPFRQVTDRNQAKVLLSDTNPHTALFLAAFGDGHIDHFLRKDRYVIKGSTAGKSNLDIIDDALGVGLFRAKHSKRVYLLGAEECADWVGNPQGGEWVCISMQGGNCKINQNGQPSATTTLCP